MIPPRQPDDPALRRPDRYSRPELEPPEYEPPYAAPPRVGNPLLGLIIAAVAFVVVFSGLFWWFFG
jgi:hypothetical protein